MITVDEAQEALMLWIEEQLLRCLNTYRKVWGSNIPGNIYEPGTPENKCWTVLSWHTRRRLTDAAIDRLINRGKIVVTMTDTYSRDRLLTLGTILDELAAAID